MSQLKFVLCLLFFLLPASLFAEVERWYVYMGAGYAQTMYSGVMKEVTTAPEMDKQFAFNWDMVHFYWPLGNSFVLGPALNAAADCYSMTDPYSSVKNDVYVFQYLFGANYMYFLGKEIGSGVFFRAEAGLSRLVIDYSSTNTGEENLAGSNWGNGFGHLGGIGYGLPVTEGTRILFMATYAQKQSTSVEGESLDSSSINFTVGVLW